LGTKKINLKAAFFPIVSEHLHRDACMFCSLLHKHVNKTKANMNSDFTTEEQGEDSQNSICNLTISALGYGPQENSLV
jgi:hypothetical protein